jgi:hypothetical protein
VPIDSRWDELTGEDWDAFASAWLKALCKSGDASAGEGDADESSVAQSVVLMNFTARAELQWRFILRAIALADSDEALGHIAAGPFEHLLGWHGEKFIAEIEQRAAIDPKLARTLTGVRQYTMSDSVWARVQSLQSEVPNPLAQDDVD